MFEPLRAWAPAFGVDWPALSDLQSLIEEGDTPVRNASGTLLQVVTPVPPTGAMEDRYEARVFLRGELEVRERNWHDLMNVLVWRAFPASKAALNARHYEEQAQRGPGNRGWAQDALTLFDEGGIVVIAEDGKLLELLRAFRWKELFWRHRDAVRAHMRFVVFGHALLQKGLAPFTGITGRAMLFEASPELLQERELLAELDARVAPRLRDPAVFARTRDLAPLPVLGVPGWCGDNEREDYYDNTDYFRPGRRGVVVR